MRVNFFHSYFFVSSINGSIQKNKSILLVCSIACGILFTMVMYRACSKFLSPYTWEPLEDKRADPVQKSSPMKSVQKPMFKTLLDDAYQEIKQLQQQLKAAKQETRAALAEKAEQQDQLKAVEAEMAILQVNNEELQDEILRLKA